jgi:threonine aldolase
MPDPIRIDMYSDTVTRPTTAMYEAMVAAPVGDDMSGLDPTVNRLEAMVSEMLDKEAAVFSCSATQSNQMAIRAHCRPGDELLIEERGHIANYEAGAPAVLSGVTVRTLRGRGGMLDVGDLEGKIRADDQHLPPTRLVCVENTTNSGGGRVYPLEQLDRIAEWAHTNGLKTHMDGARLFNAAVASGRDVRDICCGMDTVTICFSKGLGCPMGSILVGDASTITRARRARKIFGGALRQAGVVAGAAVYALENNVERLAEDHAHARVFGEGLATIEGLSIDLETLESNLVFFEVDPELGTALQLERAAATRGLKMIAMGSQRMRACTHLDLSRDDVEEAVDIIRECVSSGLAETAASERGAYSQG